MDPEFKLKALAIMLLCLVSTCWLVKKKCFGACPRLAWHSGTNSQVRTEDQSEAFVFTLHLRGQWRQNYLSK